MRFEARSHLVCKTFCRFWQLFCLHSMLTAFQCAQSAMLDAPADGFCWRMRKFVSALRALLVLKLSLCKWTSNLRFIAASEQLVLVFFRTWVYLQHLIFKFSLSCSHDICQYWICVCWKPEGMRANFWWAWRPIKPFWQMPNALIGLSNALLEL